jgi:hypothetical protein
VARVGSGTAFYQLVLSVVLTGLLGACAMYIGVLREDQKRDQEHLTVIEARLGTLEGTDRVSSEQQDETRAEITRLKEGIEIPCLPLLPRKSRPWPVFPSYK